MKKFLGRVETVCVGRSGILAKESQTSIEFELDGIVGDRHRGIERSAYETGDKQPGGTRRRNERHWSAVSSEELAQISADMELADTLRPDTLGANLCISGVPELSRLYKGSLLKFPSGAELVVVEYNPPCKEMGQSIAESYPTRSGVAPKSTSFLHAARTSRGIVGIVDVPGRVNEGDEVEVTLYTTPPILKRSDD